MVGHKAFLIQARDALSTSTDYLWEVDTGHARTIATTCDEAIAVLQAAIDTPEPEPVAEVAGELNALHIKFLQAGVNLRLGDKLYTKPPAAREPLAFAEIETLLVDWYPLQRYSEHVGLVRAVKAAVRAKP